MIAAIHLSPFPLSRRYQGISDSPGDDCTVDQPYGDLQTRQTSGSAAATALYLETSPPSLRTSLLQASDLLVFGEPGRLQHDPENHSRNDLASEDAWNAGSRRGVRHG